MPSRNTILRGLSRIGNAHCLDFVNTVHSRVEAGSYQYVETFAELVLWSVEGQLISRKLGRQLSSKARAQPEEGERVARLAKDLRELLYRIFVALPRREVAAARDLEALNTWLHSLARHRRLVPSGRSYRWTWIEDPLPLEAVLWPILDSAAALLVSDELDRVKECPAPDGCGWLFLDSSKNRSRRWCDMKACGNVAKARRFQRRHSRSLEHGDEA